ncbi:hypothetical protein [Confluentibacter sediminis]|uniref:hypothetical protein n=1 Tax=Confluentibacter sediminis TaxID=2219045 RepID=UPI0013A6A8D1|nr:hypothetical protein [Confluentibacter sediminis]
MKKILLIAIAFISIKGIAQQKMGHLDRKEMTRKMISLTPEESAGLQTKRMTLQLDLNDFQQKEVYKLNLQNAKKRKDMMASNKAKRDNGNMERPSKQELLKMRNDRLDMQIATKIKMAFILNTEQRAKWETIQEEMKHNFKNSMKNNKRFAQNRTPFIPRRF